jgi:hypothetical protein
VYTARTSATGAWQLTLPVCEGEGVSPPGAYYQVSEPVSGLSLTVGVPYSAAAVDVEALPAANPVLTVQLPTTVASTTAVATVQPGTVLVLGASIEWNEGSDWPLSGTSQGPGSPNWIGPLRWASWLNGDTFRIVKQCAASGVTSDQQLANIQNPASSQYALGLNPAPGFIYIGHVTGDDPNSSLTPAQSAANDLAIYNLMRANYPYSVIILPTLPGVNIPAGTGNEAYRAVTNPQRRLLALDDPNTLPFDFEGYYTDPTTGLPVSTYSQDQTHPNPTGAVKVGTALSKLLAPLLTSATTR